MPRFTIESSIETIANDENEIKELVEGMRWNPDSWLLDDFLDNITINLIKE